MSSVRRWYFYLVSAISLQVMTWAIIVLLRVRTIDSLAFQMAVIIVSLPLYLLHWRWATRSEAEVDAVDEDHLRVLYLFTMLAAFLLPIVFNTRGLLEAGMRAILGISDPVAPFLPRISNSEEMISAGVAIAVLGAFALFHLRLLREEGLMGGEGTPATIKRLFVYTFSGVGLYMFSFGAFRLLVWLRREIGTSTIGPAAGALVSAVGLIITGLLVWIPFWRYAQRLFESGRIAERASALRKAYLYLVVFVGTILVVSDLTIIGATLLRRALGLEPLEDTGIVLSSLVAGAFLWGYHAYVLMEDSRAAPEGEGQSHIRRVYWYLVATTGLLALLIGLGSIISVIINGVAGPAGITLSLREQLAWSTAGLAAGVLVWLLPWRRAQQEVELPPPQGINARDSGARRFYLYGFILLATLTFLICVVFVVYSLLAQILGVRDADISFTELAHALAFGLIAVAVWLYHGTILRSDNAELKEAKSPFGERPKIVILDDGYGGIASRLRRSLEAALPDAEIQAVDLTAAARAALAGSDEPAPAQLLEGADLIVGPWTAVTPYVGDVVLEPSWSAAVAASAAHKVLIPSRRAGWEWSGVKAGDEDTAVRQAVQAVQQVVAGEQVAPREPIGAGRVLLIILVALVMISLVINLVSALLSF